MQQAALDDVDVMRRRIVHVGVGRLGRAMIAPTIDLVHELVQRAAQRHVDLLQAATDREQRHAAIDRVPDQRQGGGVAGGIVGRAGPAFLAVMMRLDIGRAAGQQHAVERVEQPVERVGHGGVIAQFRAEGRDQDRQGADGADRGLDVLFAHRVMPAAAPVLLETGGNADERPHKKTDP